MLLNIIPYHWYIVKVNSCVVTCVCFARENKILGLFWGIWVKYHLPLVSPTRNYLRSYLSDRSQFVSINGFNSDYKTIKYGVPQGAVLGPLLFLIFRNYLNIAIKHSETFHFAHDTYLLNIKDSVKQINKALNRNIKFLVQWLNAYIIFLNVAKTEVDWQKQHDCDLNLKLCEKNLNHKIM